MLQTEEKRRLAEAALAGLGRSYAPYSHFHVSAALLGEDGRIYTGVNIENAAYGPSVCAERCAIFKAVSEGCLSFRGIAICGGTDGRVEGYCPPCGVCRQVMREFCAPDFPVLLVRSESDWREYSLNQLLPESFGPEQLTMD